jgi:hypothetical protein
LRSITRLSSGRILEFIPAIYLSRMIRSFRRKEWAALNLKAMAAASSTGLWGSDYNVGVLGPAMEAWEDKAQVRPKVTGKPAFK